MLYHLLYPLKDFFSPLNIFQYITFRSSIAAIMAFLISFLLGPVIIRKLKELQIGEEIRDFGPESHLKKKGTPTMGG
ncbi:MAG: phospho-N-acetylmuramoyl-pentapeptide-transferase, partial [Candidatus Marinimicrobia bacterium]|nr:phospho-N-acetylmuramoyl-pentapeptide-transferase [Candidatus Neomarinimicrobiota bacterium]